MFIRYLLLICLVITSAMPLCAAEKNTNYPVSIDFLLQEQDNPLQEIFNQITIDAKDWIDGDTYYIRYTFTNPTATRIDKEIYLPIVSYFQYTETEIDVKRQCCFDLPRLVIPPYATTAITLRLPQRTPSRFNQLSQTSFYFSDDSQLICYSYSFTNEFALPSASLRIDPDKKVYLSIHNRSYFHPISQISNLRLHLYSCYDFTARKYDYDKIFTLPNPISIDLKPREIKSIPLRTLSPELFATISASKQKKQPSFSYGDDDVLNFSLEMKLNGTSYFYRGSFDANPPFANITKHYCKSKNFGIYHLPTQTPPPSTNNVYFLDDSNLSAYIQIPNPTDIPIHATAEQYRMILNYYNISGDFKTSVVTIKLPQNLYIAPHETKYFSFQVPLPNDFYKLFPNGHTELLAPTSPNSKLSYLMLYDDPRQLLQENYTPLPDASIAPYKP